MKNFLVFFICQAVLSINIFAQDVITKTSGEELKVKVLEVTQTEVKYKRFDQQDGPIFAISKSEIFMLKYQNGTKDVFSESDRSTNSSKKEELFEKGKDDAKTFYKGKNSGAGWTAATTIILSPILGVVPAALCASAEPDIDNLNVPNASLMKNNDYNKGYTQQATKTKQKKVWKMFGISSGIWLGLLLLL